jgi:gliding motility-associated-like protein
MMKKITLLLLFIGSCCYGQLAEECFEGTWSPVPAASGTPADWLVLDNGIGTVYTWVQQENSGPTPSSEGMAGTHSAYLQRENVDTGLVAIDYLVTPEFTLLPGSALNFLSRLTVAEVEGSIYKVMILPTAQLANAADPDSYVLIEDWTEDQINPNPLVYEPQNVTFPAAYIGTTVRVAFVMEGDLYDRWLIDCVSITPPCPEVSALATGIIGLNSAQLTWTNPAGGATSWEIEILPAGAASTGTGIVYNGTLPYTATATSAGAALTPATGYRYYVRALCNDGGKSDWVGPFNFTTVIPGATCNNPIEIASLPFLDSDNTGNFANNYNDYGAGCNSPAWDNCMVGNDVVYRFIPDFSGPVNFLMTDNGSYSGMYIMNECADIGFSCLGGGVSDVGGSDINVQGFQVTAGEDYFIVISSAYYAYPTTNYTLIIQRAFCQQPVGLPVANTGMTSVDLNWTPAGATSWELYVQEPGEGIPQGAGVTTTDNTNYTVTEKANGTDLVAQTAYEYWVRADCGNGTFSAWAGPYAFNTLICEASAQCNYTFNMWSSNFAPWQAQSMNVEQNGIVVAVLTGPPTWGSGVSQEVALCDGFPFNLTWNASTDPGANVGISVVNGFNQVVYTKNPGQAAPGQILYLAAEALDCNTPLCMPPTGLHADNITTTTVDLGWDGAATGTWEYYITEAGQPAPTTASFGIATTTNPTLGAVVAPATEYEYYVRQVCVGATTPTSVWAGPYAFSSSVCPAADKCEYTFVMNSNSWGGYAGGTITVSQNNVTVAILGPQFTTGQSMEVPVMICDDQPVEIVWTNGGNNTNQMGLEVFNSFDQPIYTLPFYSQVFEGPETMLYQTVNDCDIPQCIIPDDLYAENPTLTTIDLGWEDPPTGTWEYYIVEAGSAAPTEATSGTPTTTNPVIAAGPLEEATEYEYYVRMVCQGSEPYSDWAGPLAFSSSVCPPENKCDFTFALISGWGSSYEGGSITVSQNDVDVAVLGPQFLSDGYMEITVPLCNDMPFRLFWDNGGQSAGQMGLYVINPHGQIIYELPWDNPGTGVGSYIFEGTVDCENPDCLPPTGLFADNATINSIDLSWAGPSTGNWEYYIVEAGEPAPTTTTTGTLTTVNPTAGVPLANPFTYYEYYLRSHCEGTSTDTSVWGGPYPFYSEVCDPADKCDFIFEMTSQDGSGGQQMVFTLYQNGIPVGTYPNNIYWYGPSHTEVIQLCPNAELQVVLTAGGWGPLDKTLTISSPFEDIYTMEQGEAIVGSTLYTGVVSCDPPLCLKPQNLSVSDIGLTQATLAWDEMGSATEWAVWVLPINSVEPTQDTPPTFTTTQNTVVYGDEAGETLLPGTPYEFYVMAMCGGEDGNSIVSVPSVFATVIGNNDCTSATEVLVNQDTSCNEHVLGTLTGSTLSGPAVSCGGGYIQTDVWYKFTATAPELALSFSNISDISAGTLYATIFEGDCDGGLTEKDCTPAGIVVRNDFVTGTTYYVKVSGPLPAFPEDISSFDICVSTPAPVISVNDTEYTVPELVGNVLTRLGCTMVSNVTWSTGTNYDGANGIGYFNRNGSDFPLEDGLLIASGNILEAPGRSVWYGNYNWDGIESDWPGDDEDLLEITGNGAGAFYSGSELEFDFVPFTDNVSFNFIYASNEYGTFQCSASDGFAFIISGPGIEGGSQNIAVLPGSETLISTQTIRDDISNPNCPDVNEAYFGQYNGPYSISSPIGYFGRTVEMEAAANVIQGETYHIKIVIADFGNSSYNSAVFIEAGSLDPQELDLGPDRTIADNTAVCHDDVAAIDTGLDGNDYEIVWYADDVAIDGETGPVLTISHDGLDFSGGPVRISVKAYYQGTPCVAEGSVLVEFYEGLEVPLDLTDCIGADGDAQFDLSSNTPILLGGIAEEDVEDYIVKYYASEDDRLAGVNELPSSYIIEDAVEGNATTIYVGVTNSVNGCTDRSEFTITPVNAAAQIDLAPALLLCEGATGTINAVITPVGTAVSYSWAKDGEPLADTDAQIEVTEAGQYELTIGQDGCFRKAAATVTMAALPAVEQRPDVSSCASYTLPAISDSNDYYTGTGGSGVQLSEGDVITATQTIYIYAVSDAEPHCTNEGSFVVNIIPLPEFSLGGPYVYCDPADATVSVNPGNFGLADATFEWKVNGVSSGDTGSSIQGTEFGAYEVTVTVDGCTATQSVTITESNVQVALTPPFLLCEGATGTISAAVTPAGTGTNYSWTKDGEPFAGTDGQIEVTEAGEYEVTIDRDGCIRTAATTVTAVPLPAVEQRPDVNSCSAYTLPALADSNDYFTGPGGSGTLLVEGDVITSTQTIYIYALSDTEPYCTNESSFAVTITTPAFSLGGPYVFCDPADAIVSVNPENFDLADATFAWTINGVASGEAGSSIQAAVFGTYEVTVTLNGCTATHGVAVAESGTEVGVTITDECIDDVYTLTASGLNGSFEPLTATYAWAGPEGFTAATQAITPQATGTYNVVVATPENCTGTASFDITSTYCFIQRGISPNNDGDNDSFDLTQLDVKRIGIFNRYGMEVYSRTNYTNEWNGQAGNGDELPTGTYFYSIERRNGEQITGWIYINREI